MSEFPIKAVALVSGGLDSMLAAKIMQMQGIQVLGIHISTGFCTIQKRRRVALPSNIPDPKLRLEALHAAAQVDIPIEIIDVSEQYLPVFLNPKHGYGSHMNPCQDCHAFMLSQAKKYMEQAGASFIITGEVVGQRPNSQKRHLLFQTEKESGLKGLILRPLSAKLLPPSIPEQEGWVDRESLYDISGRGRKVQIELAEKYGFTEYAQPSGGCCLLVDEAFSQRLRDFLAHNPPSALNQDEIALLSVGRHLRLPDGVKVIIGRHEGENYFLDRAKRPGDWRFEAVDAIGPVAVAPGPLTPEQSSNIAGIVAGYTKKRSDPIVTISIEGPGIKLHIDAEPVENDRLLEYNINKDATVKRTKK